MRLEPVVQIIMGPINNTVTFRTRTIKELLHWYLRFRAEILIKGDEKDTFDKREGDDAGHNDGLAYKVLWYSFLDPLCLPTNGKQRK